MAKKIKIKENKHIMKNKKWAKVTMLAAAFALIGAIAVGVYALGGLTKTIDTQGKISYAPT